MVVAGYLFVGDSAGADDPSSAPAPSGGGRPDRRPRPPLPAHARWIGASGKLLVVRQISPFRLSRIARCVPECTSHTHGTSSWIRIFCASFAAPWRFESSSVERI